MSGRNNQEMSPGDVGFQESAWNRTLFGHAKLPASFENGLGDNHLLSGVLW